MHIYVVLKDYVIAHDVIISYMWKGNYSCTSIMDILFCFFFSFDPFILNCHERETNMSMVLEIKYPTTLHSHLNIPDGIYLIYDKYQISNVYFE